MAARSIDENELAKRLKNIMTKHADKGAFAQEFGLAEAIVMINDMPAFDFPDKWASVKDRLPVEEEEYLVVINGVVVTCAKYEEGDWSRVYDWYGRYVRKRITDIVTHWMPLPNLPTED